MKVVAGDQFPADLVLLSCSDTYGISYVGTVQLDGETNLKDKTCLPEMMEMFKDPVDLSKVKSKNAMFYMMCFKYTYDMFYLIIP